VSCRTIVVQDAILRSVEERHLWEPAQEPLLCSYCASGSLFFAQADTGLPMILVEWPAVILALLPVILIEAAVHRRQFGTPYRKALYPVGVANLASTFIGYPLAWMLRMVGQFVLSLLLMLVMQFVGESSNASMDSISAKLVSAVVHSAWLPGDAERELWMLPAASLIGLVPAFFVSVYSEAWVLRRLMKGEDKLTILAFSYRANLASYAFLAAIAVVILIRLLLRP
jgi:hypothetical protein